MKLYRVHLLPMDKYMLKNMYNIELYLHSFINEHLVPTIPRSRMNLYGIYEDNKTDRICFSGTIEGCFTALGTAAIEEYNDNYINILPESEDGYTPEILFVLFEIDSDNYKCTPSDELYMNDLVIASYKSKEWWVHEDVIVKGRQCVLNGYTTESFKILPINFNRDFTAPDSEEEELRIKKFTDEEAILGTEFKNLDITFDVDLLTYVKPITDYYIAESGGELEF